jgi:uncharacterized protein
MATFANLNRFSWYELMTSDTDAAAKFYGAVVGWTTQPFPDPSMPYTLWVLPTGMAGGLTTVPEEAKAMGVPPHWVGTITVASVDDTVTSAVGLGATVLMKATTMPNVGRFAILRDPTGAAFSVLTPASPTDSVADASEVGRVAWHELWSTDPDAAWTFYSTLFGWVETGTMDMGSGGTYRMYGRAGEASLGGIAKKEPMMPSSAWLFYVHVESVDDAANRLRELGGTVVMGPMDVPGGGRVLIGMDPQGAAFALHSRAAS